MTREHKELLLSLARQYLDGQDLRNYNALVEMCDSRDARLRAIARNELAAMVNDIIARVENPQNAPQPA